MNGYTGRRFRNKVKLGTEQRVLLGTFGFGVKSPDSNEIRFSRTGRIDFLSVHDKSAVALARKASSSASSRLRGKAFPKRGGNSVISKKPRIEANEREGSIVNSSGPDCTMAGS
jgi:hypothetical protein